MELLLGSRHLAIDHKPLILAVDDDEDNLLVLKEVLSCMSCLFMTATSGQAAINLSQTCRPDLILLDVMLPDCNGIDVVQRLKQNPQIKSIPVVAVTALAAAGEQERLRLAGFDDYISKPYMLGDMEAIIQRYTSQFSSVA